MKTYYGLIGAGGHGREVMPMLRSILRADIVSRDAELVFVVEDEFFNSEEVNGHPVITLDKFYKLPNPKRFNVAIADSKVRSRIAEDCLSHLIEPFPIVAKNAVILDNTELGIGHMISLHTIITSNVIIGRFFHANCQCNISHDCIIGDYVTFAPGVRCSGNVTIEDHAYIGTGAAIMPGKQGNPLTIGRKAIVGMGAVVTKSVPPGITVVGNPAQPLIKG